MVCLVMEKSKTAYELVDSGAGLKLERLGDRLLIRPSSVALWNQRNPQAWSKAHATFDPKAQNWQQHAGRFTDWTVDFQDFQLSLTLQTNGQIGFFPDHLPYMPQLRRELKDLKQPRVLNLFAYTGMASVVSAQAGAHVTHVDVSKKCLTWAKQNFLLNNLPEQQLRLIPDDALQFLKREHKRTQQYDLIIADPPSFYRLEKNKIWKLDEHFHELLSALLAVLNPAGGKLFLTCHSFNLGIFRNLILDFAKAGLQLLDSKELELPEVAGERRMPAGVYALCQLNKNAN